MTLRSPLMWPTGWKRQPYRTRSPFKVSLAQAQDELYEELERLGASSVVVSSNAKLNLNGTIAARQTWITDPGVCVYFVRNRQEFAIPCDMYESIDGNLRAIGLTVAAIRAMERYGTKQIVDAAFQGFAALPPGGESGWWTVLGVSPDASRDEVEKARRDLVRIHHPDTGGNRHMFELIEEAYQQALAAIESRSN